MGSPLLGSGTAYGHSCGTWCSMHARAACRGLASSLCRRGRNSGRSRWNPFSFLAIKLYVFEQRILFQETHCSRYAGNHRVERDLSTFRCNSHAYAAKRYPAAFYEVASHPPCSVRFVKIKRYVISHVDFSGAVAPRFGFCAAPRSCAEASCLSMR